MGNVAKDLVPFGQKIDNFTTKQIESPPFPALAPNRNNTIAYDYFYVVIHYHPDNPEDKTPELVFIGVEKARRIAQTEIMVSSIRGGRWHLKSLLVPVCQITSQEPEGKNMPQS